MSSNWDQQERRTSVEQWMMDGPRACERPLTRLAAARQPWTPCARAPRVLLGFLLLFWGPPLACPFPAETPEDTLTAYLQATYARDYATAYLLLSVADRQWKTVTEYVREHGGFTGGALELTRVLAALMRFENLHTEIVGDRATVAVKTIRPHLYAPVLRELLLKLEQKRLEALSPTERAQRANQLRELARSGRLPVVREHERWELVWEDGHWRIFLNWAGAIEVHFEAALHAGLPWEFAPLQSVVRAKPGDQLQTFYRVKNRADRAMTAAAWHSVTPPEETGYLEIVHCFCFRHLTLAPGEEKQLPVVFQVTSKVPDSLRHMHVRYTFDPLDKSPGRVSK